MQNDTITLLFLRQKENSAEHMLNKCHHSSLFVIEEIVLQLPAKKQSLVQLNREENFVTVRCFTLYCKEEHADSHEHRFVLNFNHFENKQPVR